MNRSRVLLLILTFVLLLGVPVWGNSAEPPSILLIVPGAPDDLVVSMVDGNRSAKGHRQDKMLESYFLFYLMETRPMENPSIMVEGGEYSFSVPLGEMEKTYQNTFTLDLEGQTLREGKDPLRSAIFVVLRVALTLVIEGLVFFLFGFRNKSSWIAFLVINLITQGSLNIWISTVASHNTYTLFMGLVVLEFLILIAEMIGFLKFTKEKSKLRTGVFVLVANILSLYAGGYILMVLPF